LASIDLISEQDRYTYRKNTASQSTLPYQL
jgi:hypothetical protein